MPYEADVSQLRRVVVFTTKFSTEPTIDAEELRMDYIKFQLTDELREETLDLLEKSKKGKLRAGINEVTKAIERGTAKFVLIAEDVSPKEIVMHLPVLCKEKNIAFSYVATKAELGEKSGLGANTSAVAVIETSVEKEIKDLAKKIADIRK